jgi:hypothetical protein
MASYCSNCGAPVSGQFCTACGVATKESPAQTQNVMPQAAPVVHPVAVPPPVHRNSGAKILFIVLGVLILFGAAGVGGVVYVGYRAKQKIAEMKKDYGLNGDTSGPTSSSSINMRTFPPSKGSGCSLLEGQEAATILGVAVERAESETSTDEGALCKYWVSATERRRLIGAEIASSVSGMGKGDTKSGQQDVEKLIGGAAGALIEANGDNKDSDYAFSLQMWPKNGKEQWDKTESIQARTKDAAGADFAGVAMQPVEGVGDRATVLASGHSIMVLKGDTFFLLGFQQFVPGRDKTVALARVVAGRM